jgi:hypothetical protein
MVLDTTMVTKFTDAYDYYHSDMWITILLNGEVDKDLMKKAIILYSKGDEEGCQKVVERMFREES